MNTVLQDSPVNVLDPSLVAMLDEAVAELRDKIADFAPIAAPWSKLAVVLQAVSR